MSRTMPLSPQQRRILEELAKGKSRKEVASSLTLSAHTVDSHLKTVFNKTGAHSVLQALNHCGLLAA